MIRCKFLCCKRIVSEDGSAQIGLGAVIEGSDENKEFFKWTPAGNLEFFSVNPAAAEKLELGKFYYVDISEAPE